jgi:Fe-S-cluster-containing hydrogenase component 2
MDPVYAALARHLNRLPAGFPPTDDGVELKILKRLFTPEEAAIAQALTLRLEGSAAIAERLGTDGATLEPKLEVMAKKGLIFRAHKRGRRLFMAAQFVIGIWEYHVNDLDEDLIRDVNAYMPTLMRSAWLKRPTKQLRVVPVARSLPADMTVMPYEAAEALVRDQSKIVVSPCICRREHAMVGKGCNRPLEVCLSFGTGAHFYEENGLGRPIGQAEALELLKSGMEAGLVLQPGNAQKPANICMCCGCCCQVLKNLKTLDRPAEMVASNFFAEIAPDRCTGCGVCAERCQMDAIRLADTAAVLKERCIGCGLCVAACDAEAVFLRMKPDDRRQVPPARVLDTYLQMARERLAERQPLRQDADGSR